MRKWIILIVVFILFAVSLPVNATKNQFELVFPEGFEKTSESTWHADSYSINYNDNLKTMEVDASITFENSKYTEETVFSEEYISEFNNSISSADNFKKFVYPTKERIQGTDKYRCISASYLCEEDGEKYVSIYKFYSKKQCCTVKFISDNSFFAMLEDSIIYSISLDGNFFTYREITDTAKSNTPKTRRILGEIISTGILFMYISMLFVLPTYFISVSNKKKKLDRKDIKLYIIRREFFKLFLAVISGTIAFFFNSGKSTNYFMIISIIFLIKPLLRLLTLSVDDNVVEIISAKKNSAMCIEDTGIGDSPTTYQTKLSTDKGTFLFYGGSEKFCSKIERKVVIVRFKFEKKHYMLMRIPDELTIDLNKSKK